jgi:hypothetical protein
VVVSVIGPNPPGSGLGPGAPITINHDDPLDPLDT